MTFRQRVVAATLSWIALGACGAAVAFWAAGDHLGLACVTGIAGILGPYQNCLAATRGAIRSWRSRLKALPHPSPRVDWALMEAMREVDRMLPGSAPICPNWPDPMPAPPLQKLLPPIRREQPVEIFTRALANAQAALQRKQTPRDIERTNHRALMQGAQENALGQLTAARQQGFAHWDDDAPDLWDRVYRAAQARKLAEEQQNAVPRETADALQNAALAQNRRG